MEKINYHIQVLSKMQDNLCVKSVYVEGGYIAARAFSGSILALVTCSCYC